MNQPTNLPAGFTPAAVPAMSDEAAAGADGESLQQTLSRFHRTLRGQYAWIVTLVFVCAAGAAVAGWWFAPLLYRSEGLVRIAPAMPKVLQENPNQNQDMPQAMYETFLQSQKLLITSRRVIDEAVASPLWQATGRGNSTLVVRDFAENLFVEIKPKTEYINISYADRDPLVAAAGVNAVIEVYSRIYQSQDRHMERQVLLVAEEHRKTVQAAIDGLNARIDAVAAAFGSSNVDPLFETAVERVKKLQGALSEVTLAATLAPDDGPATRPATVPGAELTALQIASRDSIMGRYCEEVASLETRLELLKTRYGENHAMVANTRLALSMAKDRVANYVREYRVSGTNVELLQGPKTRSVLQAQAVEVAKLLEQAKEEMISLGQKRRDLALLHTQREAQRDELLKISRRIDTLQAEGALGGRLSIISKGEAPVMPAVNYRIKAAAAGLLVGSAFPIALFLLIGLYRAKFRSSEDAQISIGRQVPLLGILPMLRGKPSEQDAIAAQCVHQIRVMLQSAEGGAGKRSRVLLSTSSSAGEGKTSLTLSLGLSFAASGVRTLVIDCDLTARTISRGFGEPNEPALPEAMAAGEVNGYVRRLAGCLSVLTAGRAESLDANTISPESIRRLLADARKNYDVVLIDSGPILGSIEAALSAREVDGVIFTVARGQQQSLVNRAMAQLASLGTSVVGVVFNRAEPRDFYRSAHVSTYRSTDPDRPAAVAGKSNPDWAFGPLVWAVLQSLPAGSQPAFAE